jgi:hypothetical protein
VGYLASKNNVQEYKVYTTIIWMFDPIFGNNLRQVPRDNVWLVELKNWNYMTCLLCQVEHLLRTSRADHYSLIKVAHKKWPKDENDLDDNNYELPI